jgi:hypothetical protein
VPKFKTVPFKDKVFAKFIVPANPVRFKLKQLDATFIVAVPLPLLPLKNTSSTVVGTDAPEAPPDVADQFVVEL